MCSRRTSSYFRTEYEPDPVSQKLQESNYSQSTEEAISDLYKAAMKYWDLVNLPFKVQWTGSIPMLSFSSNSTSIGNSKSKSNSEKKSSKKSSRKKSGLPPPPLDSPRPRYDGMMPCRYNFKPEVPSDVFSSLDFSNRVLPRDPLVNLADYRHLALQQPRHRIFGSSDLDEN
ncbi:hypothetical protein Ddc_02293 [Ditylenchus destructor]|nr:hypothetical protein Ddc_02293 [Ditylenchus destructor]